MTVRTLTTCVSSFIAQAALGQATPFRGTHIGFDTEGGLAGQQILLKTGYGTGGAPESEQWAWRFQLGNAGGQLQTRTQRFADNPNATFDIARFNLFAPAPATWSTGGTSPVAGWYANSNLTSNPVTQRQAFNPTGGDAFLAAGRLVGGDFAYEIMSVTPLNGSPAGSFALAPMGNRGVSPESSRTVIGSYSTSDLGPPRTLDSFGIFESSLSGGGTLADRSIFLGYGNHVEGWGFFVSTLGTYEIAMRVYDVNGKYATSQAFTFQVTSIPAPGALALIAGAPLFARRRRA